MPCKDFWFYNNGQPFEVADYENGKKHGEMKRYNPDGRLLFVKIFESGKQIKKIMGKDLPDYDIETSKR